MTIYLDIIFLENACMNYIILLATGLILKRKISYIKILLSSILGSIYVIVSYVTNIQTLFGITMKILLSIAMTYIAFSSTNIKKQIKELLVFYLVSFAFGGTAFAMIYFLKPQNIIMKNGVYIGSYALNSILIGALIGFILINIVFKFVKRKISKEDMNCKMKIIFEGKEKIINTMIDTGNMLKDPITKKQVAIVEKNILEEIISGDVIDDMEKVLIGKDIKDSEKFDNYKLSFTIIPFSSLGKEHGLILGFKPDLISIYYEEKWQEIDNVLVGIYNKKLFHNNKYNALIGLECLSEGGERDEHIEYIKI